MTTASAARPATGRQKPDAILAVAVFKLAKSAALAAVGFGALRLLHKDVAETVLGWVNVLRVDPENRFIHAALNRALSISPAQLKATGAGTLIYAALLLTEGVGLLLRKRWAEYFTIITTALLIPLEIYEIAKHLTALKILVLIVNVAIVIYLIVHVRNTRPAPGDGR